MSGWSVFMKTTIRPIEAGDVEAFRNTLDVVCREEIYLLFVKAPPYEKTKTFVLKNIETGNPQFVAINHKNQLVGWCDICRNEFPGTGHVGHLGMGLLPESRGRGIGKNLICTTIEAAFRSGFERIELEVFSSNLNAKALYETVGFQLEGTKRNARILNGKSVDSVIMGMMKNEFKPNT